LELRFWMWVSPTKVGRFPPLEFRFWFLSFSCGFSYRNSSNFALDIPPLVTTVIRHALSRAVCDTEKVWRSKFGIAGPASPRDLQEAQRDQFA
jgi:hypothetical protein